MIDQISNLKVTPTHRQTDFKNLQFRAEETSPMKFSGSPRLKPPRGFPPSHVLIVPVKRRRSKRGGRFLVSLKGSSVRDASKRDHEDRNDRGGTQGAH